MQRIALTREELGQWYRIVQTVGRVHHFNHGTLEYVADLRVMSILHVRQTWLNAPNIYNTSTFDSLESIKVLEALLDTYLPKPRCGRIVLSGIY